MMQVRRRRDHDDLGPRSVDHVLPAGEDPRDAVAARDRFRAGLVALTYRDDAAPVGLERGDVSAAVPEPDDADRRFVSVHAGHCTDRVGDLAGLAPSSPTIQTVHAAVQERAPGRHQEGHEIGERHLPDEGARPPRREPHVALVDGEEHAADDGGDPERALQQGPVAERAPAALDERSRHRSGKKAAAGRACVRRPCTRRPTEDARADSSAHQRRFGAHGSPLGAHASFWRTRARKLPVRRP